MFGARSRCLLVVGLVMAVCASFANAAVFDVGLQAGVVQSANLVSFDVEKPLPALVQSEAALTLMAIVPNTAVEQHERRLGVDANAAITADLFAQARAIEKVGWRVSF